MGYSKRYPRLSRMLQKAREKAGLSQAHVAQALNYSSAQFISNWERNAAKVPLYQLKKLIFLYKLDKAALIEVILQEEKAFLEKNLR